MAAASSTRQARTSSSSAIVAGCGRAGAAFSSRRHKGHASGRSLSRFVAREKSMKRLSERGGNRTPVSSVLGGFLFQEADCQPSLLHSFFPGAYCDKIDTPAKYLRFHWMLLSWNDTAC